MNFHFVTKIMRKKLHCCVDGLATCTYMKKELCLLNLDKIYKLSSFN